jgi:selenocysteine lyase/cysteine desulfurase
VVLLQSGGDGRIVCDPITGRTAYGSALQPTDNAIALASCTASTISQAGLMAADAARRRLVQATLDGDVAAELQRQGAAVRAAIASHYDIPNRARVVLTASGTDAELLALALAAQQHPGQRIVNVLVAPEESGSGVPYAGAACHFADQTPMGLPARRGTPIAGFPAIELRTIPGRDDTGAVRSSHDIIAACAELVQEAQAIGALTVLHLLDGSKTGYTLPDPDALQELAQRHPQHVRVVVDACQGRSDPARIRLWLNAGWVVLVTGSKFYGGPPFSGAVLIPPNLAQSLDSGPIALPAGLSAYSTRADWPEEWAPSRELPEVGNPGLLLRWQAALPAMAEFKAIPARLRESRLRRFATSVAALIAQHKDLVLLQTPAPAQAPQTIFTFHVLRDGRALTLAEAKQVHRWLYTDISGHISELSTAEMSLARRPCLIGQPVALPSGTVLRIAAGAARGAARTADARVVLNKISLILKHWAEMTDASESPLQAVR